MTAKNFFQSKFMLLFGILLVAAAWLALLIPKGELEWIINQNHTPAMDFLFKYLTWLGDGIVMAFLIIGLLFYNYRLTVLASFSAILQAIFISLFKRWLFAGLERPLAFFDHDQALNFVEGVDVHTTNSFPSGHTTTAFALFALLFIIINKNDILIAGMLLLGAVLVGFSRVYLLQHFVIDVYFGALFGILSVIIALFLMEKIFSSQMLTEMKNNSLRTKLFNKK